MATNRKLQSEIEKVLKKVAEGVEIFEMIFEKIQTTTNATQKEKFEMDLKKEIKKLQRYRDQIKTWLSSNEIKDKRSLTDNRKLIEQQMEKFKACEKELKTKAYSKEGLSLPGKVDPQEKEKAELSNWVTECIEKLNTQIDAFEAEAESLQIAMKKTRKADSSKAERMAQIDHQVERHKYHITQLEIVLRMLENGNLTIDKVKDIKDDVNFYVDSNQDSDFNEDEGIYDDLNLDQEAEVYGFNHDDEKDSSTESDGLFEPETPPREKETSLVEPYKEPPKSFEEPKRKRDVEPEITSPPKPTPKAPPNRTLSDRTSSEGVTGKPPIVPVTRALPVKAASAVRAAPAARLSGSDAPASGLSQRYSAAASGTTESPKPSVSTVPDDKRPIKASSPVMTNSISSTGSASPAVQSTIAVFKQQHQSPRTSSTHTTESVSSSAAPPPPQPQPQLTRPPSVSTAAAVAPSGLAPSVPPSSAASSTVATSATGSASTTVPVASSSSSSAPPSSSTQHQASTSGRPSSASNPGESGKDEPAAPETINNHLPASLADLVASFEATKERSSKARDDKTFHLEMLETSFRFLPEALDSERPKYYMPKNPYPIPTYYPQTPSPIQDNPQIFEKFDIDTLFFIFYYQQGTYQQYLAARELKRQSWRFHKKYLTWFQRHEEPKAITDEYEQGTYIYFDYEGAWCQRKKTEFRFEYRFLEDTEL